jgi:heme exporter protein C
LNVELMEKNRFSLSWWKTLTIVLLIYAVTAGLLSPVPRLAILNETIRNLYFHVPMWFGMTFLLLLSCIFSILYLVKEKSNYDTFAIESANTGITFGILGLITGMIWARFTWGTFWTNDPKLNAAAVGMLIYSAYFVLRGSFSDDQQKAKVSAVYNILAFPAFVALVYILPRLTDSLHPGNGGNPGFNSYDRDRNMNIIFYSAGLGFILLGVWITTLRVRLKKIQNIISGIN